VLGPMFIMTGSARPGVKTLDLPVP
jgi:hypothetical protein